MSIENKLAKPVVEIIEHIAQAVPKALGHGHHRIAQAADTAADEFDHVEKDLAGKAGHHPPAAHVPHESGEPPLGGGTPPTGGGKPPTGGGGKEPGGTGGDEGEAARKAAEEEAKKKAQEELDKKIADLRTQGHAPGRHLDVDIDTLRRRLGATVMDGTTPKIKQAGPNIGHVASSGHVDPLTKTTTDGEHGGVHRCGPYATKFDDPADMAKIDDYCRTYIEKHGQPPSDIPIADVLGEDGHTRLTGVYKNPSNPDEFLPVDFEGGSIVAPYKFEDGKWKLHSMFPDPAPGRHP